METGGTPEGSQTRWNHLTHHHFKEREEEPLVNEKVERTAYNRLSNVKKKPLPPREGESPLKKLHFSYHSKMQEPREEPSMLDDDLNEDVLTNNNLYDRILGSINSYSSHVNEGNQVLADEELTQIHQNLEHIQDINLQTPNGDTLLHIACNHHLVDLIPIMLAKGGNPNICNNQGLSPITIASNNNDQKIIELFEEFQTTDYQRYNRILESLERYNFYINSGNQIFAEEELTKIRKYINSFKDINLQDPNGNTILHEVCSHHLIDLVTLLLEKGANPNISNGLEISPLNIAYQNNDSKIVKLFLKAICIEKNFELLRELIHSDIDLSNIDDDGNSILHIILHTQINSEEEHQNKLQILRELASRHPDIFNKKNVNGVTPLMLAAQNNDMDSTTLLLQIPGIKTYEKDNNEHSFLNYASEDYQANLVNLTLSGLIDIPIGLLFERRNNEHSLFHSLMKNDIIRAQNINLLKAYIENNHPEVIDFLIHEKNFELLTELMHINTEIVRIYDDGSSTLHHVLNLKIDNETEQQSRLKLTRELITKYPDLINKQNVDGITPLMTAVQSNDIECTAFLLQIPDIKPHDKDKNGHSFLYYASDENHAYLVKLLLNGTMEMPIEFLFERRYKGCSLFYSLMRSEIFREQNLNSLKSYIENERPELLGLLALEEKMFFNNQKIIESIENGDFEALRNELKRPPSDIEMFALISSLRTEIMQKGYPLPDAWREVDEVVQRCEQISQTHFEKEPLSISECFQIALYIETVIKKSENVYDNVIQRNEYLPRAISLAESGQYTILSRRNFSLIQGQGATKSAKCALRVLSENRVAAPTLAVTASIRDRYEEHVEKTNHEWRYIQRFEGKKGFVQGHCLTHYKKDGVFHIALMLKAYNGDLLNLMLSKEGLSLPTKISIAKQLLIAVRSMHEDKVAHGDLKPGNILYSQDDKGNVEIAISDFEMATDLDRHASSTRRHYGTPCFSSPEICFEKEPVIGERADLWAAGATLFSLIDTKFALHDPSLMGESNYEGAHYHQVEAPFNALSEKSSLLPEEEFKLLIYKLIRYQPYNRISIHEAINGFEALERSL